MVHHINILVYYLHIPDGYLDPPLIISTYILTAVYYIILTRSRRFNIDPEQISIITTLAAGIFVAQMLNWPIPGGTSLHFVGGVLASMITGPYIASLIMSLVLLIQCLIFHDGGITALGANILNMAVIDVWIGYLTYRSVRTFLGNRIGRDKTVFIGGLLGGWAGITIAGAACGVEIGLSSLIPYGIMISLPIMAGWHAVLGVVEGLITGSVGYYLFTRDPKILRG